MFVDTAGDCCLGVIGSISGAFALGCGRVILKNPPCFWISEIMLQQTRLVAAVIQSTKRFLDAFPDVNALPARARSRDFLGGLGRARFFRVPRPPNPAEGRPQRSKELGGFPRDQHGASPLYQV